MASRELLAQIRSKQKPEDPSTIFLVTGTRKTSIPVDLSLKRICYDYLMSNVSSVNCENLVPELKYDLLHYISGKRQVTNSTLKALCCPLIDSITLFDNSELDDAGVEAIAQNCPNLNYIRFYGCTRITSQSIRKLLLSCSQVKTLSITISKFTDDDISSLLLPQIENLHLRVCKELKGDFVAILNKINLNYFDIRWCDNIRDHHVLQVASMCDHVHSFDLGLCKEITDESLFAIGKYVGKRLLKLDIEMCFRVTDLGILQIAKNCENIEFLSIKNCELVTDTAIEQIANSCLNLKVLNIAGLVHTRDATIELVGRRCTKLQNLYLMGIARVSNKTVSDIVENCKELTLLDTTNCSSISSETRKEIAQELLKRM